MVNLWDNVDGGIECGHAGESIFWEQDHFIKNLTRLVDYGRLLAPVSLNGCSINNVNADARVVPAVWRPEIERVAADGSERVCLDYVELEPTQR